MATILSTLFKLGYEISPILLVDGIAKSMPGGALPIVSITEAANFVAGLLSGGSPLSLDNFFAHFKPVSGGTIIDQQIGMYPFANQSVAANAVITQPLRISMLMICPAKGSAGYPLKLAIMANLQKTLAQHNALGGLYTIVTPSYIYTNCVMTSMRDVSSGESKQAQTTWQLDFLQPLITLEQAKQAQNAQTQKLTNGGVQQQNADGLIPLSGLSNSVGSPQSGVTPSVIPAATSTVGASVSGASSSPQPSNTTGG